MVIKTYTDQHEAMEVLVSLRNQGIEADLGQKSENGVLIFELQVDEDDTEQAQKLMDDDEAELVEIQNHFLEDYTDEELLEILMAKHEYEAQFVTSAGQLLKQRRPDIDLDKVEAERSHRAEEVVVALKPGKRVSNSVLIFAYLSSPAIGLIFGLNLELSKKKAPDGNRYYEFDQYSRAHGQVIKWLGIVSIIAIAILKTISSIN